jgi:23S rRNA (cytidine1920-2'-O)/16S rRNA (cytidine1409-2'-O)-methyltransferase
VTADLSFISLDRILPPLSQALRERSRQWKDRPVDFHVDLVLLVKPQFEVGKGEVGKGGIVRVPEKRLQAVARVESAAASLGYEVVGNIPSPISGTRRNQEFLLYLRLFPDL